MNNNLIPFIILFFSIVIIYGILTNKKNERVKNYVEKFSDINQKVISNSVNNTDFTTDLANGTWTTTNTKVDSNNNVTNLMNIEINSTTIDYTNPTTNLGSVTLNGRKYNISFFLSNILKAELESSTLKENLRINFLNNMTEEEIITENAPFSRTNTQRCIVSFYIEDRLQSQMYSYKIYENQSGGEVSRIIEAKDFFALNVPQKYNFNVYNKLIGDYKYPLKFLSTSGAIILSNNDSRKSSFNTIQNQYNRKIKFCIQRVFQSPTNNEIITKMSPPLFLDNITKNINGKMVIADVIEIVPFKEDKILNNLDDFFIAKATILYFYKLYDQKITYDFSNKSLLSIPNSSANLRNNADNMFKQKIEFNDVNSVEKVYNNKYKITLIFRVNSDTNNKSSINLDNLFRVL